MKTHKCSCGETYHSPEGALQCERSHVRPRKRAKQSDELRKAKQELRNARKALENAVIAADRATHGLDFATGRLEVAVAAVEELTNSEK